MALVYSCITYLPAELHALSGSCVHPLLQQPSHPCDQNETCPMKALTNPASQLEEADFQLHKILSLPSFDLLTFQL